MYRKLRCALVLSALLCLLVLWSTGCALSNLNQPSDMQIEEATTERDTRYEEGSRKPRPEPETRVETVTDENGEPLTDKNGEDVTEIIVIDSETEAETRESIDYSNWPEELWEVRREYLQDNVKSSGQLKVIAWGTPNIDLRDETITRSDQTTITKFENALIELKALGVNCIITADEWKTPGALGTTMSCAKNQQMNVWYNCTGQSDAADAAACLKTILSSTEGSLLTGVLVSDRPSGDELSKVINYIDKLRESLGDYRSAANLFVNLRPYDTTFSGQDWSYAKYIQGYNSRQGIEGGVGLNLQYAAFYYAPYQYGDSGAGLAGLIYNMTQVRGNAGGLPIYPVISIGKDQNSREITLEELRAQINICLALGAKGYILENACEREDTTYGGLIRKDGSTTPQYESARAVFEEIDGMREQYLAFQYLNLTAVNYPEVEELLGSGYSRTDVEYGGRMSQVSEANGGRVLIGNYVGKDSPIEGEPKSAYAYYIVNPDTTHTATVTCTLTEACLQELWTSEGCARMAYGDTVTLELGPGEGVFLIVGRQV